MSSALNLIIARGFPELGSAFQRGMDDRKQFDTRQKAAGVAIANAQQDQQFQVEDRQREQAAMQAEQTKAAERQQLLDLIPEVDARLRANPNDPEARALALEIHNRLNPQQATAGLTDILYPKPTARPLTPEESARYGLRPGTSAQMLPNGQVDVVQSPPKPVATGGAAPAPPKPPTGYVWRDPANPSAGVNPLPGGPTDPNVPKPLSPAEIKVQRDAKAKLPRMKALERRLDRLDRAVKTASGGMINTGPADQYVARFTPAGQELQAASSQLLDELTALTRIPGIGTQSDLETRLKALTLPSLDLPPEVNQRNAEEIRAFARDLRQAIESAANPLSPNQPTQDAGVIDFASLPD